MEKFDFIGLDNINNKLKEVIKLCEEDLTNEDIKKILQFLALAILRTRG